MEFSEREIGWLITKDHTATGEAPGASREGWGQLRIHASETERSYDRPMLPVIFMDKSLTEHMIPDEQKVRWRSFDDDFCACYDGLVRWDWIFPTTTDDGVEELAYNIDRFCSTDAGGVHVFYSSTDIIERSKLQGPHFLHVVEQNENHIEIKGSSGLWAELYG